MVGNTDATLKRRARMLKEKLNDELGKSKSTLKDLLLFSRCVWGVHNNNKDMNNIMKDTKMFKNHYEEYLLCLKYINTKSR